VGIRRPGLASKAYFSSIKNIQIKTGATPQLLNHDFRFVAQLDTRETIQGQ